MTTLPAESNAGAWQARACLVKLVGSRFAVEVRYARDVVVFEGLTVVAESARGSAYAAL